MSNNINNEIKTIVAELQSMSPRTQLEIVRLCKRVAELTPDYIDDLTDEQYAAFTAALNQAKTELQSQITTNRNDIDSLEVRTGDLEDRAGNIEDSVESLQTRMSTAETSIQSHGNSIDALETDTATIDDKLDTEISVREAIVETTYENTYPVANLKAFNHTLQLKGETGDLLLDGESLIGGKQLYQHYVKFSTGNVVSGYISFISSDNTPINTFAKLNQFLISRGLNDWSKAHVCNGIYTGNPSLSVIAIYTLSASEITLCVQQTNGIIVFTSMTSFGNVTDTIITL